MFIFSHWLKSFLRTAQLLAGNHGDVVGCKTLLAVKLTRYLSKITLVTMGKQIV